MNPKLILLSVLIASLLFTCSDQKEDIELFSDTIIYNNSFENSAEVENFEGMQIFLSNDTPNGGGDSSMVVSGGCVLPHVFLELGPFDEAKVLSFNVYGKALDMAGGGISLSLVSDPDSGISILVQDTNWAYYETSNTLEVPIGEKIRIDFISGGIISVTTFFDLFEIEDN